jgi:hypothetical protein
MKMFIVNNANDLPILEEFCELLKGDERDLLDALRETSPVNENEKYKEILNTFNTAFTVRTAVEDGINIFKDSKTE